MINFLIIILLAAVAGLVIVSLINDRKTGKSSCGGDCASCGLCSGGKKHQS